ncbi:hypothetical protein [Microbacterium aurum]
MEKAVATMTQVADAGGFLDLQAIDTDAWRLCDTRAPVTDASYIVAYVERVDDGFEVVWMRGTQRRCRMAALEECAEAAARRLAEEDSSGASRPIPIAHFPPRRGL